MQMFIYCKVTLHVSGFTAPIIRSIKNCTRSLRYRSYYLYRYSPPTWSVRDWFVRVRTKYCEVAGSYYRCFGLRDLKFPLPPVKIWIIHRLLANRFCIHYTCPCVIIITVKISYPYSASNPR